MLVDCSTRPNTKIDQLWIHIVGKVKNTMGICLRYYGQGNSSYDDTEEYFNFQEVFRSDLKRFLTYYIHGYQDNEKLTQELKNVEEDAFRRREYNLNFCSTIEVSQEYLSFRYPTYDDGNTYTIVYISRDYRRFYFIEENYPENVIDFIKIYELNDNRIVTTNMGPISMDKFMINRYSDEAFNKCMQKIKSAVGILN